MKIKSVFDQEFSVYGRVLEGYDFTEIIDILVKTSEKPGDKTIYIPSESNLEAAEVFKALSDSFYGGMPIQAGYCNGSNAALNCLEYHRGSEINIAADDIVLLVASLQKVKEGKLNTSQVEAFLAPAGTAVQLYETTLHYAPCNAPGRDGFRVVIILPLGTNTEKPVIVNRNTEDALLWAKNKWLMAHKESPEAGQGAYIGLSGPNIIVE